ncbi:MAG TPA: NTP transferase domain-containing protein [Dokdonella sp.]|uniref:NTP transferase domain-containing protein n=1 Tax=Dokdonella sp. TaxID=2291710 RepID=UPI002CD98CB5|nr:NTP transferase domain-containing protein [Dokdonella sp.]HUD43747.1 NTP transferase domain-containing protein [Dokdonella sp.]
MSGATHTVAVLAGGAATRLDGRDKGLVPLGGRPLVDWVLAAPGLRRAPEDPAPPLLIVANRNLEVYARYAATIHDVLPGQRGPLAGIAAALAACRTDWLLSVPVDCPLPPPDLAVRLLDAPVGAAIRVAHDGVRRQPLFALYARALAAPAAAAAAEQTGVHAWQDAMGAVEVDFGDRRVHFDNLNTPSDFAAFRERFAPHA